MRVDFQSFKDKNRVVFDKSFKKFKRKINSLKKDIEIFRKTVFELK